MADSHERENVIQHWYHPEAEPITIVEGNGTTVYDEEGNEYVDFLSQLYCCNAGHGNERIRSAVEEQLERIQYVASSKHNDTRTRLADSIGAIAPGSLSDVFFAISGSEANETAIQIARTVQDASTVLTRWQSYHGGTYGAGGLTGDPSTRKSLERYAETSGTGKFLPPIPTAFGTNSPEELTERASDHLEFVIQNEGPDSVAAVLMEPVGGTSGAYPAPPGYFQRVRELCDEYDVLLITDEVITGFGRCGEWFGIETENVQPDILTFAKGVTSAYVPLGGVVVDDWIGDRLRSKPYDIGQTFAGHPVACAAGEAAIEVYRDSLIDQGRAVSPYLERRLRELEAEFDVVDTVRGRGLLWSVVFADPDTGEPFVHPWIVDAADNPVSAVRDRAESDGVLFGSGRPDVQVVIAPPLCVSREDIDRAVDVLETSIGAVFDSG